MSDGECCADGADGADGADDAEAGERARHVAAVEKGIDRMSFFIATFLPTMLYFAWRMEADATVSGESA